MKNLNDDYKAKLEEIANNIQESEEYKKYIEDEEDEDYQALRTAIEPSISALYREVVKDHPLQLVAFEKALADPKFEGMYLPRILGFIVLRGEVNENYKYIRPQQHFNDTLTAICNSFNFDFIRKRIGQTIQTGFALSSDIWITNLINQFANKRIRYFLQGQKLPKYRILKDRKIGYLRYKNQFKKENYFTAEFPTTPGQLKVLFSELKTFVIERIKRKDNNESFKPDIFAFLENPDFKGTDEHIKLLGLFIFFFSFTNDEKEKLKSIFNELRSSENFETQWFDFIKALHNHEHLDLDADAENQLSALVDRSIDDNISVYYNLMDEIHSKGYPHEATVEAVKSFYGQHEGRSTINECVRLTIFGYFSRFMNNIGEDDYHDYFELSKIFPIYMDVFDNEKFNHDIKMLCMKYVKKLLKRFTDKRGKDYQEIRKFVVVNFEELGFLNKKQLVEFFKTKRKKPKPAKQ